MLTIREDKSKTKREQIISRIEQRQVERDSPPEHANLAVFASPEYFGSPIISITEIDKYMYESTVIPCGTRRPVGEVGFTSKQIEDGVWCIRGDNHNFFWELNEYGIIYNREWVEPEPLTKDEVDHKELYLPGCDILNQIHEFIRAARGFYQRCKYADNIEIVAELRQVNGQKLKFKSVSSDREDAKIRESTQSEILASVQCLPQTLQEVNEFERVLFGVSDQIVGAFNQQSSQRLWQEKKWEWRRRVAAVCDE